MITMPAFLPLSDNSDCIKKYLSSAHLVKSFTKRSPPGGIIIPAHLPFTSIDDISSSCGLTKHAETISKTFPVT